ncbi:M20 family peptidase [Fulvivirga sedimenti]|uniref:M20 family peptidase n=1 Tax=Fulvivirga sedimenti TaxID=2879465 RepID=A0A9X1HT26_9BACT|nr:M20 family peptidase [Fulvivirga sedimenti]MCA6075271.1 M20 family peptidase [Fulvivirga sedimenti]MCA6076448.1 M20 family peptidase [Fulvivirga sedimenti]MCA6077576.1 M20 family peptidase [Fulvivirga sedimenti]
MIRPDMKKIFLSLLTIFIFLIAVMLFNTFTFDSQQVHVDPVPKIDIPASAKEHMSQAITIPTVSNEDPSKIDSAAFFRFHEFIKTTYPLADSLLGITKINTFSLIYEWKGTDPSLKPVILMGHMDVVPVAEENIDKWDHPPFGGEIRNGMIYGRGAIDDKVSVIGNLEAVELLLSRGFQPNRTIYLCFGHDEEIGGINGATAIVEHLKNKGVKAEFVLDEGFAISQGLVPGIDKDVALIGTAEKGFVSLKLSVALEGGHSSMPGEESAIDVLARAVVKLKDNPFPAEVTQPVNDFMDHLGPEMPFTQKVAFANRWLLEPVIMNSFSESASGSAMLHTTTAPTIFNAGIKENVIPYTANATVNFRILPGTSIQDVKNRVASLINDDRIVIGEGSFNSEAPQSSSTDSHGFVTIRNTIKEIFPEALTSPNLVVGATDSRYYYPLSDDVYRFTPIHLTPETIKTFHGINERLSVEDFENAIRYYVRLIENATSSIE